MSRSLAYINPQVLRWARETRMGWSLDEFAAKMKLGPTKVAPWEQPGGERPTIRQAQKAARVLKLPFGYLYLSNPPAEPPPIADYRRMTGVDEPTISADLREVIYAAQLKQERYKDLVFPGDRVPLAGAFSESAPATEIAARVRSELKVGALQSQPGTYEDFARRLIASCEGVGILVMRSGCVGHNNHRKLALPGF